MTKKDIDKIITMKTIQYLDQGYLIRTREEGICRFNSTVELYKGNEKILITFARYPRNQFRNGAFVWRNSKSLTITKYTNAARWDFLDCYTSEEIESTIYYVIDSNWYVEESNTSELKEIIQKQNSRYPKFNDPEKTIKIPLTPRRKQIILNKLKNISGYKRIKEDNIVDFSKWQSPNGITTYNATINKAGVVSMRTLSFNKM